MLNFVIGTAGTGKSSYITEKIVKLAKEGQKCLLLVPEQFSRTGETILFSSLDNTRSNLVDLFSFSSLLRDVDTNHRILGITPLTTAGKAVMARRATANVKKMLSMYARQADSFGFSFILADTFDDLKRSGIDHNVFHTLAENAPDNSIRLKELSLIYSEYCGLLGDKFCDEEDVYVRLSQILPFDYTYNTHVFIDGFESFSHGQLKIIEKMMTDALSVTVALTCDSLFDTTKGTGNFSFVQNTAQQLIRGAKNNNVEISAPVVMKESHRFISADLKNTDLFLQGKDPEMPADSKAFVTEFETQFAEVCFVAAKINNLVKQGYTYNDIAVVSPQLEKYENQLQESFTLAQIPYFIDAKRIISSSAPVVLFKSIFSIMADGPDSENILPLLKTGMTCFEDEDISLLENYLYVWQDYSFDMSLPFSLSPSGLKPAPEEKELETLAKVDRIRSVLWDIFGQYSEKKDYTGSEILEKCYEAVTKLGCDEKTALVADLLKKEEDRSLLVRQWETAIQCLDNLYRITGDDVMSCSDMESLFMLMVEGVTIGFAPQTQDCVMITDPKRMKLEQVKAVFIIGAAQDFFPAIVNEGGLISPFDRMYLKESNYPLKNNFENLFSFENLYYYKALTSPSEYLFVSACKKNIDSRQLLSSQVDMLKKGLNLSEAQLSLEDYAVTKEFFTDYLSGLADNMTRQGYTDLLAELGIEPERISPKNFEITDLDLLTSILGNSITISPTNAQSYFQCAFMYFMQKILSVKPLQKAEFSARIAGDYLHFIAQNVMEKYGENYYKADWEEILNDVDSAVDRFIKENYPPEIYNDTKFTAQYENMKANAIQLLSYIHTEQNDSMFRPVAFEEKIGSGGRVPPLTVETEAGNQVNIIGVADRVDIYRGKEKDYLRIVDYKTGSQKFSLDDVYNGLSSQLLLYMNALLSAGFGKQDKELAPGAVLYQPSDARFKFDKDDEMLYTAIGMA
ncbi:MAG: PD-(D/E)XK nuclease family protein, partial [Oscillospiraceae bacterium]|nr:PD-(D/E)XK nuclease family protein [Oscillospiraceae bacterium]